MSAPALSPTEALLSQAAAVSGHEVHLSRLALIECGGAVVTEIDKALLVAGDGTAGQQLLGGPRPSPWPSRSSCAIRSSRLLRRESDPDEERPAGGAPWRP